MKDPLVRFIVGAVLLIASVIAVLWMTAGAAGAQETFCNDPETGEPGLLVVDVCYTVTIYDELYSVEALADVASLSIPGRSVADVYALGSESPARPASERPRVFMGVEEPSYAELVARAEDAFDNPALEGLR